MKVNLYLREIETETGTLIGTIDPTGDEPKLMRDAVEELGVGGEVFAVYYQFINDDRGAGIEYVYSTEPQ